MSDPKPNPKPTAPPDHPPLQGDEGGGGDALPIIVKPAVTKPRPRIDKTRRPEA